MVAEGAATDVSLGGASSPDAPAVSDATAFSAAFFFFFPDLGFAEVLRRVKISVSELYIKSNMSNQPETSFAKDLS